MRPHTREILDTFMDSLADAVLKRLGDYYRQAYGCIPLHDTDKRELYLVFFRILHDNDFALKITARPRGIVVDGDVFVKNVELVVSDWEQETVTELQGMVHGEHLYVYLVDAYGLKKEIYYDDAYTVYDNLYDVVQELSDTIVYGFDIVWMHVEKQIRGCLENIYDELHGMEIDDGYARLRLEHDKDNGKLYGRILLDLSVLVLMDECSPRCVRNAVKLHERYGNIVDYGRIEFKDIRIKASKTGYLTDMRIIIDGYVKTMTGTERLFLWKPIETEWYRLIGRPGYKKYVSENIVDAVKSMLYKWLDENLSVIAESLENMRIN